ncbi:hypothetical protein X992_5477 [Burkholderia pseudomallei MSHR5492]|nr:hypothetical protein X992_5477 [Burkholderia pseudomallei MSHR5492]
MEFGICIGPLKLKRCDELLVLRLFFFQPEVVQSEEILDHARRRGEYLIEGNVRDIVSPAALLLDEERGGYDLRVKPCQAAVRGLNTRQLHPDKAFEVVQETLFILRCAAIMQKQRDGRSGCRRRRCKHRRIENLYELGSLIRVLDGTAKGDDPARCIAHLHKHRRFIDFSYLPVVLEAITNSRRERSLPLHANELFEPEAVHQRVDESTFPR